MDISALYDIFLLHPSVRTDSRGIGPGDLFFALKGPSFDGNRFALAALEKGAAFAVVDDPALADHPRCLYVEDALSALQALARHHRARLGTPIIAITGSNGKTTTKELLHAVLSKRFRTLATEGNLNNHIGVPLTLLRLEPATEMAIVEMGANHMGEIASYCEIALPDYGVITNCGKAHLEGFGSLEGVKKAKGELYDYLRKSDGAIFRNADLDYLADMAKGIAPAKQVTYGTANAQVIGKVLESQPFLRLVTLTTGWEAEVDTNLVGAYNMPNVMVAVAVGKHFGLDIGLIKEALEAYAPSNSRSQWLSLPNGNKAILDAYNANPTSMKLALDNFAALSVDADQKWVILGGMKELGVDSELEHQALIDHISALGFRHVLLMGPEFGHLKGTGYEWFPDHDKLATYLSARPLQDAYLLIKGSRGSRMERVLESFPG